VNFYRELIAKAEKTLEEMVIYLLAKKPDDPVNFYGPLTH
jgi:hypothetical protein